MTRRRLFRLISYILLGILLIFLLIVYSLYLSAQRMPDFYKASLAVSEDRQRTLNDEMRHRIIDLNNAVETSVSKEEKTWTAGFSAEELNAWFAVELPRDDSKILPPEIMEPRLAFSDRQLDFACRFEQESFVGILHLTLGLEVPEPNRLAIRIRNARLGTLPISRDIPARLLVDALEKKGYEVRQSSAAGDPVISFVLDLKHGKKRKIQLENLTIQDGAVRISGETEKVFQEP